MRKALVSWALSGFTLCGAAAALAHHSVAYYSATDRIELAGEIASIQWQTLPFRFELRSPGG